MGRAEKQFRESFERLKINQPLYIPKGSKVTQNNVAKEAAVDPSALRRSRFPQLVAEIQQWKEDHSSDEPQQSPRQMILSQRSRNRSFRERNEGLKIQRDHALAKLVDAEARIVELTIENERMKAQLPRSSVVPVRPSDSGRSTKR